MSDDSHEYDDDALAFIEDERARISALHLTCPKQIWLQIDPEAEQFDGWEAQTWCSDQINDTDVRYVLAASRDAEVAEYKLERTIRKATEYQLAASQKQVALLRKAGYQFIDAVAVYNPIGMDAFKEALAATADLSGVILCHAEPDIKAYGEYEALYRAWEPKP